MPKMREVALEQKVNLLNDVIEKQSDMIARLTAERDEWQAKAEKYAEALEKLGCSVLANGTVFEPPEGSSKVRAGSSKRTEAVKRLNALDDGASGDEIIDAIIGDDSRPWWDSLTDLLTDDDERDDNLNPDGLPVGLTISDDGMLLDWRGENYVRQTASSGVSAKRAAAVERLKNCVGARFNAESIVVALTGGRLGQGDWSLECDSLIHLLTDDDMLKNFAERMKELGIEV